MSANRDRLHPLPALWRRCPVCPEPVQVMTVQLIIERAQRQIRQRKQRQHWRLAARLSLSWRSISGHFPPGPSLSGAQLLQTRATMIKMQDPIGLLHVDAALCRHAMMTRLLRMPLPQAQRKAQRQR